MRIKIILKSILGAFFPSHFFNSRNKKEEIDYNEYAEKVERAISSPNTTEEEVQTLATLLSLSLMRIQCRLQIQASPIMGAREESLNSTMSIGRMYIELIKKLREHFPKYLPDKTKEAENGETPESTASPS